jgi:hypothetical protein
VAGFGVVDSYTRQDFSELAPRGFESASTTWALQMTPRLSFTMYSRKKCWMSCENGDRALRRIAHRSGSRLPTCHVLRGPE